MDRYDATLEYERRIRELEDVLRELVPDGEILTHFDVLVSTRSADDTGKIRAHRFAPTGSDPELSLGKIIAASDRLRVKLSRSAAAPALEPE